MKRGNQTNALLVELLIVILFFMLGATILIRVFGKSYELTSGAEAAAKALVQAQNTADTLYASKDVEGALQELGFEYLRGDLPDIESELENETAWQNLSGITANVTDSLDETDADSAVWVKQEEDYELRVTIRVEELDHGHFVGMQVEAIREEEVLISLPCSRYEGEGALAE